MLRLALAGSALVAALAACSGDAVTTLPPSTTSTTLAAAAPIGAGGRVALATAETDPSTSNPDDVAIWVHPMDPAASRIIATEKDAGLAVYDLDGRLVQALGGDRPNNVDLRYGFPWPDGQGAIVTAGFRATDALGAFGVDPASGTLVEAPGSGAPLGYEPYGSCMYRSPVDGSFYVFVNDVTGDFRQYRVEVDGAGSVVFEEVRTFSVATQPEGCVADDERRVLYLGEEVTGIWRVGAEPDAGTDLVLVDGVDGGRLTPDVEGLALYPAPEGGYLLAASQASGEFVVYELPGEEHVLTFRVGDGDVDGTARTDGIDVVASAIGAGFPNGLFVAHDPQDETGAANFKLVPWERIAALADPPLAVTAGG